MDSLFTMAPQLRPMLFVSVLVMAAFAAPEVFDTAECTTTMGLIQKESRINKEGQSPDTQQLVADLSKEDARTGNLANQIAQVTANVNDLQNTATNLGIGTGGLQPMTPTAGPAELRLSALLPGTVRGLTAKSHLKDRESQAHANASKRMGNVQNEADKAALIARQKSVFAQQAEIAHEYASESHKQAAALAKEAAESREKANTATRNAADAKAKWIEAQSTETNLREFALAAKRTQKKANVEAATMSIRSDQMDAAAADADVAAANARQEKTVADDVVYAAKRKLVKAEEALSFAKADTEAATRQYERKSAIMDNLIAKASKAMKNETDLGILLGQDKANSGQAEVEEEESEKEQEVAREEFDVRQEKAHTATEAATFQEAKARAAVQDATELAAKAHAMAKAVEDTKV